jgi:uncharacterized membrane protein YeaQ/YmgE (transglycosylase-associated protein family)
MVFHGIVSAIIVGPVIGGLGRLVLRGKQRISMLMTIVIGIAAALIGTFLAVTLGVANTTRIDWFELFIQVGLAAIGVTLYNGGAHSRGLRDAGSRDADRRTSNTTGTKGG